MRTALRIAAPLLIIGGLVLIVLAFWLSFSCTAGSETCETEPGYLLLLLAGFPILAIGATVLRFAYIGPASSYLANELRPAVRTVAGELRQSGESPALMACLACGVSNPAGSNFCGTCGTSLASGEVCATCGASRMVTARYCVRCGEEFRG